MSQACSHPKSALVVPDKVAPYFSGEILPKPDDSVGLRPKNFRGKVGYYANKSMLLTGPTFLIGSGSGFAFAVTAVPDPSLLMVATVLMTFLAGTLKGASDTILGVNSVVVGDGKYSPLSPTKKYLELEASKQKAIIAPFENWDQIFNKNDARVQRLQEIAKRSQ